MIKSDYKLQKKCQRVQMNDFLLFIFSKDQYFDL